MCTEVTIGGETMKKFIISIFLFIVPILLHFWMTKYYFWSVGYLSGELKATDRIIAEQRKKIRRR